MKEDTQSDVLTVDTGDMLSFTYQYPSLECPLYLQHKNGRGSLAIDLLCFFFFNWGKKQVEAEGKERNDALPILFPP